MSSRLMLAASVLAVFVVCVYAADIVPNEVMQPGTQPMEVGGLESPDKCDNCHGGYSPAVEPAHNWRGSMMAQAGRDPLFWATVAVAEQDFDGAGDLCIRCHSPAGWVNGRSTPTDGSGLVDSDSEGVQCDLCHTMTRPDGSEHAGEQFGPFLAHDEGDPPQAYLGSGMYVLMDGSEKLGPYDDAAARHKFLKSSFHRSEDFCGSCHDVSNPVVGDLAHNAGVQPTADFPVQSGTPGSPVDGKAAFNNFPFQYGIVERTFSEFKAGLLGDTPVSAYETLPAELQGGALEAAYLSAMSTGGDYADGTVRTFTCQTCHMRPVTGTGCNKKGAPIRPDLPLHDLTGGNYWVPDAIKYLDSRGLLRLGGGLTAIEIAGIDDGKARAMKQLSQAASLAVTGDTLRIVNHTGHKLISGYPEGRRMWFNIKWFDVNMNLLREDGEYGDLQVLLDGFPTTVRSILDLDGTNTKIYEAHYGMTSAWANQLLSLGYDPGLVLEYDRVTGLVEDTLADLAAHTGESEETFHFVLNNTVLKDNRIPTYGMNYEEARRRNALPVPEDQYTSLGGGIYDYFDELTLSPPTGAEYATIDLLYQPTSWEYIQFLYLANTLPVGSFLANEGAYLLEAWMNTGMAEPYVMTSTTWGNAPVPATPLMTINDITTWCVGKRNTFMSLCATFGNNDTVGVIAVVFDPDDQPLPGSQVFAEILDPGGTVVTSMQGFSDENGEAIMTWKIPRRQASGTYTVNIIDILNEGSEFDADGSVVLATFQIQ